MNSKTLAVCVSALIGIAASVATPAHAALTLTLSDGVNTVSILDGGPGDWNPLVGDVGWVGSVGSWKGNMSFGSSNAGDGASVSTLDLFSMNVTSGRAGGNLTITLTETGFTVPSLFNGTATTDITGFTAGKASFSSFFNGSLVSSFGYGTGAFSGESSGAVSAAGGYTLKNVATITHKGAGSTAFEMITSVPEPATIGVAGLGLLGLGFARRRRAA